MNTLSLTRRMVRRLLARERSYLMFRKLGSCNNRSLHSQAVHFLCFTGNEHHSTGNGDASDRGVVQETKKAGSALDCQRHGFQDG